ncbi:MAG: hypothetical protein WKF59_11275 [Chitinophagaceae bacterium]
MISKITLTVRLTENITAELHLRQDEADIDRHNCRQLMLVKHL